MCFYFLQWQVISLWSHWYSLFWTSVARGFFRVDVSSATLCSRWCVMGPQSQHKSYNWMSLCLFCVSYFIVLCVMGPQHKSYNWMSLCLFCVSCFIVLCVMGPQSQHKSYNRMSLCLFCVSCFIVLIDDKIIVYLYCITIYDMFMIDSSVSFSV